MSSNGSVDGYDAATGNLIWSLNDIGGNSISSATAQGDRVFIGASSSGFDGRNASGRSLCLEFLAGATEPKIAWRAEEASCHYVSVLANDRLTWHVNKTGVVCCVGIDGKTRFRKRTLGQCWATPLLVNELVYLFAKDGRTTVLESGEFYKEVTVNQLWDTKNPPAPDTYVQSRPKPTGHGNAMQQAFEQLKQSDHNSDGKIEKEELPEQLRPFFPQLDTNQDGMIDKKEIDAMEARMRQSTTSSPSYGDPIVYGVAVGDGAFFVRTGTRIYCVRKSH
ncbi:MAG: EF-hand domain-containing protein [Planctomycetota bacterium]